MAHYLFYYIMQYFEALGRKVRHGYDSGTDDFWDERFNSEGSACVMVTLDRERKMVKITAEDELGEVVFEESFKEKEKAAFIAALDKNYRKAVAAIKKKP